MQGRHGVERSLHRLVAAMLHGYLGYEPQRLVRRLGDRIPQACGVLAGVFDHTEKTSEQMEALDAFCDAVIKHRKGLHASALGRLTYTDSLDHNTWAAITIKALAKTGGRIGQSHAIVKRILENQPTPETASILAWLVEVQANPARPQTQGRHASHRDGPYPRRLIAEGASQWLDTAEGREAGDEYSRLEEKLADHGLLRPTGPPETG